MLDAVESALASSPTKSRLRVGVVVYVNASVDDPIEFRATAELVVARRASSTNSIVGFGVFGNEANALNEHAVKYFRTTFEYLKHHNVNVVASAGQDSSESVLTALHHAGASRISGGFKVHLLPRLANYLAMHHVPIELSPSHEMKEMTADVQAFLNKSPFRLFLDIGLDVTLCSFRIGFTPYSRSDTLHYLTRTADMHALDVLTLLASGFRHNFSDFERRQRDEVNFWRDSRALLSAKGFKFLKKKTYFPVEKK